MIECTSDIKYLKTEEYTACPQVEKDSTKCYNDFKTEDRGVNNMSLVGLVICNDGIVGIGDYKSTTTSIGDFKYKQKSRDVEKVFKNNNFIFATYGANEIYDYNSKTNLENVINKLLYINSSIDGFFGALAQELAMMNATYNFVVGFKDNDGKYRMIDIEIKNGTYIKKFRFTPFVFAGDSNYFNAMASLYIDVTKGVKVVAEKLEKALKSLIEFRSVEDKYQTVGLSSKGEVNIKIFQ